MTSAIRVQVVDAHSGEPIEGATLTATVPRDLRSDDSDAAGRALLMVAAGSAREVGVHHRDYRRVTFSADAIGVDEATDWTVVALEPRPRCILVVRDERGQPASNADVNASFSGGRGRTDRDGEVSLWAQARSARPFSLAVEHAVPGIAPLTFVTHVATLARRPEAGDRMDVVLGGWRLVELSCAASLAGTKCKIQRAEAVAVGREPSITGTRLADSDGRVRYLFAVSVGPWNATGLLDGARDGLDFEVLAGAGRQFVRLDG